MPGPVMPESTGAEIVELRSIPARLRSTEADLDEGQFDSGVLPSGIPFVDLRPADHIGLFVLDGSDTYRNVVRNFVLAGLLRPNVAEFITYELATGRAVDTVREELVAASGNPKVVGPRVDIKGWDRNSGDYQPSSFDIQGMHKAMGYERDRMRGEAQGTLRVASEDCTAFIAWLENPQEYVDYEHRLISDLLAIVGQNVLQLCVFRVPTLRVIGKHHKSVSFGRSLLDLAISHNVVVCVDRGRTITGMPARKAIVRTIGWRALLRHPILTLRVLRSRRAGRGL